MDSSVQKGIQQHWEKELKNTHLRQLLDDGERNQQLVAEFDGVLLDYTHEKLDKESLNHFESLAKETELYQKIEAMFQGKKINSTENRAVLHVALRSQPNDVIEVDGVNVVPEVHKILQRIAKFTESIRSGEIKGYTGRQLKNTVVIGIGGSYLGIEFVYEALRTHSLGYKNSQGRNLRFLANVDPVDFARATQGLDVEETLFVINSKTFTTAETMINALRCKQWILSEYEKKGANKDEQKQQVLAHLCAVSTNLPETSKFGIVDERVFGFWDWVGGRYSVCSAIGILPLSLHFGFTYMVDFLRGANAMDEHFLKTKEVKKNLPILLGMITWHRNSIQDRQTIALLPYSQSLLRFPAHIQQLSMESNGKQSLLYPELKDKFLEPRDASIFGEPGTNSQHSFFQLLHQGKNIIPCEFIGYAKSQAEDLLGYTEEQKRQIRDQHDELMSNFFAQVDALARGKTAEEVISEGVAEKLVPHKVFPGDRSSIQILFRDQVNPYNVGQLLALYEHRVAVCGFLWNINSFDQWGVELGKVLAKNVKSVLTKSQDPNQAVNFEGFNANTATKNLISKYREFQK